MWKPHLLELFPKIRHFKVKEEVMKKKAKWFGWWLAIANMTNVLCYIEMNQDWIDRKFFCWNTFHVTLMNFGAFGIIVIMIELEYILTHQLIHMQRPGNDFYLGGPTNVKNCQQLVCISYLVIPLIVWLSKKICSCYSVLWGDLLCFQIPPFCHKYIHLKIQNNFSTIFSSDIF